MKSAARLAAVVAVILLAAWALQAWVVTPNTCNARITRLTGASILAEKSRDSVEGQMIARKNLIALRDLEAPCSTEINLFMLIALNEQISGDRAAGIAAYDRALELDQRPEIHTARASLLLEEGRIDEAVAAWSAAVKMSPMAMRHVPEALQKDVAAASGLTDAPVSGRRSGRGRRGR